LWDWWAGIKIVFHLFPGFSGASDVAEEPDAAVLDGAAMAGDGLIDEAGFEGVEFELPRYEEEVAGGGGADCGGGGEEGAGFRYGRELEAV